MNRPDLEKLITLWTHKKLCKSDQISLSNEEKQQALDLLSAMMSNLEIGRNSSGRGEYMDIETYISSINEKVGYSLPRGRSRNDTDQYVLRTTMVIIGRQIICKMRQITDEIESENIFGNDNILIPFFTQNQPASITCLGNLKKAFVHDLTNGINYLAKANRDLAANRKLGCSIGSGSFLPVNWVKVIPHCSGPILPFSDVSNYSYIQIWINAVLNLGITMVQYLNTVKVYADCSNCLTIDESFGKSSAIPNKKNLFRIERAISILSQLNHLFSGFQGVILRSTASNDYLNKQYLRDTIDFMLEKIKLFLSDFEVTIRSSKFDNTIIEDRFYFYHYAEILSIEESIPYREAYILAEDNPQRLNGAFKEQINEMVLQLFNQNASS